jgi:hypothetical protein
MLTRATIAVAAAAAILAAVSSAQAGSRNFGDQGEGSSGQWGYRIGPLGQPLGAPYAWRGRPSSVRAYVPREELNRRWLRDNARGAGPGTNLGR